MNNGKIELRFCVGHNSNFKFETLRVVKKSWLKINAFLHKASQIVWFKLSTIRRLIKGQCLYLN